MEQAYAHDTHLDLTQIEDPELVVLASECGYQPAQDALVLRYYSWISRRICWLARHRGLTATETEDAVQDAVFGILKAVGRYDTLKAERHGGCQFRTFLNRVLTDRFKDFVKQLRRSNRRCHVGTSAAKGFRPNRAESLEIYGIQHLPDQRRTNDPAAVIEHQELVARLREVIERLHDADRLLLEAHTARVSWQVIASKLGLSCAAANHRWRVLRRRLALQLEPWLC